MNRVEKLLRKYNDPSYQEKEDLIDLDQIKEYTDGF